MLNQGEIVLKRHEIQKEFRAHLDKHIERLGNHPSTNQIMVDVVFDALLVVLLTFWHTKKDILNVWDALYKDGKEHINKELGNITKH